MADNPPASIIRVMIVEDHPLFRSGLQSALELAPDIRVIGTSENGEQALLDIDLQRPDIILLDVNLPGINGLQVTRQIKTSYDEIAVIILTAHHDQEQVLHAMRTGASAYCAKNIHAESLIQIIRDVYQGFFVVDNMRLPREEFTRWLFRQIEHTAGPYAMDAEGHFVPLSPREMEILEYVTHGLINKEIASKLGISQQTVKNHMTSILKKLNVKDRTQAAITALRRGWVRMDNDTHQEA
jgi:DNA-binding NarL/FixJ family response regulator